jgi:hypothetical protein
VTSGFLPGDDWEVGNCSSARWSRTSRIFLAGRQRPSLRSGHRCPTGSTRGPCSATVST